MQQCNGPKPSAAPQKEKLPFVVAAAIFVTLMSELRKKQPIVIRESATNDLNPNRLASKTGFFPGFYGHCPEYYDRTVAEPALLQVHATHMM